MASETPLRATDWRLAVWRQFLQAHNNTVQRLERDLGERADLPLSWYDVLLQLAEAPERRLRMAQLADRVLLSRSGLTRLVDRLQRDGLVRREPFPGMRAAPTRSSPTPASSGCGPPCPSIWAACSEYWLAHFSDDELRQLGVLLGRVGSPDTQ